MSIPELVSQATHRFTLVYADAADLPENFGDPLCEAGCDDALVCTSEGLLTLDFDRKAASFREALISAIAAVDRCDLLIRLVRVEPLGSRDGGRESLR